MPHRLTLAAMSRALDAKELSPVELTGALLAQIERVNPQINAFVSILADQARESAREAEARQMKSARLSKIDGIPITIKDSLDVAGLPTLAGSRFRLGHIAKEDSTPAARLRAAGAVLLGKTNCPELLANYESDNHITGYTFNPAALDRTAGGSSGGEAAAIAAFCSAGGVGSDGGGSIRIPAHYCGIAGLKPTPGRVPARGHFPAIEHPGGLLGVVGPMARTIEDVELLFDVLAGHDPEEPFSAPVERRQQVSAGLKVGVMEQFYDVPVESCMRDAVRAAAAKLGDRATPFLPEGLERAPNVWAFFFNELTAAGKRQYFEGREDQAHWTGLEFLDPNAKAPSGAQVVEMLGKRDQLRASLLRQMRNVDVLLTPVASIPAHLPRERRWTIGGKSVNHFQAMMLVTPFNLFGMPAAVIPWTKTAEGLPIGLQIAGKPWAEESVFAIARELSGLA